MIFPLSVYSKSGIKSVVKVSYSVIDKNFNFYQLSFKKKQILINDTCYKKMKNCLALKAYDFAPTLKTDLQTLSAGGKDPGSVMCEIFHGEVFMALDKRQNHLAFCLFKDGSAIDSSDLFVAFNEKNG